MTRLEAHEKTYIQSSRPWECGNPEGISKECGKGGKPASWLSTLSILCHFHGLLFAQGDARISATSTRAMGRTRKDVFVVIVVDECIGDLH